MERRAAPKNSHIPHGKETAPDGSSAVRQKLAEKETSAGIVLKKVGTHKGLNQHVSLVRHETFKKQDFSFETLQRKKISEKCFTRVFTASHMTR